MRCAYNYKLFIFYVDDILSIEKFNVNNKKKQLLPQNYILFEKIAKIFLTKFEFSLHAHI